MDDAPTMMTLETVVHREIRYGSLPNHRLPLVDVVAVRGRARRALLLVLVLLRHRFVR